MAEAIAADTLFTTHELAQLLKVNQTSVIVWAKHGLVPAWRTPGGHRRYVARDVVAFLKQKNMPVPVALAEVQP